MKNRVIKFTVIAKRWFDRINGNTYHSVRCIRHRDGAVIVAPFQYGYGDHYRQTALEIMVENRWLEKKYTFSEYLDRKEKNLRPFTKKIYEKSDCWRYERENNYPILWNVSDGLKRDCIANGEL